MKQTLSFCLASPFPLSNLKMRRERPLKSVFPFEAGLLWEDPAGWWLREDHVSGLEGVQRGSSEEAAEHGQCLPCLCLITLPHLLSHLFLIHSLLPHLINHPGLTEEDPPRCCEDHQCLVLTTESWTPSVLMILEQIRAINTFVNYRTPKQPQSRPAHPRQAGLGGDREIELHPILFK